MRDFLYNFLKSFNSPKKSAAKYTVVGAVFSSLLSILSVGVIWFVNTPFFDFRSALFNIINELFLFKVPLLLVIIGFYFLITAFSKQAVKTVILAFVIKLLTTSFMTYLITVVISKCIIDNKWFEADWLIYLPYSYEYPIYSIVVMLLMWGLTWYFALYKRLKLKLEFTAKGEVDIDVIDKATTYLAPK
ncbi:hypothetical protein [Photobacterium leiognathi]|uniref:hypothetical protein n=1 Tax=Photobacterium leiognathi TaxID=553611 RepID=UPI002981E070|nr:hypothetical protein [Photobacterium leiognathi]